MTIPVVPQPGKPRTHPRSNEYSSVSRRHRPPAVRPDITDLIVLASFSLKKIQPCCSSPMGGEKLSLVAGETRRLPSTTKKRMKTTACFGYCQLYFGVIGLWAAVRARKHDEEGYEYEDDENLDDDGEQGDWEVFYNGSTPCAPPRWRMRSFGRRRRRKEKETASMIPSLSLRGDRTISRRYLRGLVSEGTVSRSPPPRACSPTPPTTILPFRTPRGVVCTTRV
jgi:hypothetical protein